MTGEEISMILNTFMYIDYREADDGMTLNEILDDLSYRPDCQEGGLHFGEYTVLLQAAENPEIGELIIDNQSYLMGWDEGTAACTFSDVGGSSIYVVYRGTGDGEWPDNGLGMTQKSTIQQERALAYFETVVERQQVTEEQRLIVTGHSKGGNKAQYVVMSTKYDDLLDACYNIDGQGFSEQAISGWKETWGSEGFEKRTQKITGIYGENDYVNVLGNSIVPHEQVHYVKTPVKVGNFAGYHDIKYMFSSLEKDAATGEISTVFHGKKNDYVMEQGSLGSYAGKLSDFLMQTEPEKRDGCASVIMQLMELAGTRKTGLNGEKLTLFDIGNFIGTGIPLITESLFFDGKGQEMLFDAFLKKSFSQDMNGQIMLMADYSTLARQTQILLQMADKVNQYKEKAQEVFDRMPLFMKSSWNLCRRLKAETDSLGREAETLKELSEMLDKIVRTYADCDAQTADEILLR